jgi:glycosyltransferase involved in cell wall biosynthesis
VPNDVTNAGAHARELWIHALAAKAGGGVTYLRALLPALAEELADRAVRVVVLAPRPRDVPGHPDGVDVRPMPGVANSHARRLVFDQVELPRLLRRRPGAVLYCSGNYAPVVKPVPTVVLVRNAIYFDEEFLRREQPRRRVALRLQGTLIARGARGCVEVHYPTHAMRDLVEASRPGIAPAGAVNPYGVADAFFRARERGGARRDVVSFLYVMNYTLQKNLGFLLDALALARKERLAVRAVVTSRLDRGPRSCFARDREIIETNDLVGSGYLVPAGPTFGDALVDLYGAVDACVFPSFCESFGHPLVEAMAAGKPVVCADRPYARELCGDHALYVDPNRPSDLVELWRRWPELSRSLPQADASRLAERFSWRAHAARLVGALLGGVRNRTPMTAEGDRADVLAAER